MQYRDDPKKAAEAKEALRQLREAAKPGFQPSDPLSVKMRKRREEAGQKTREAAPRLRAKLRELRGEDDSDA